MITVSSIHIYPVKSMAGHSRARATVLPSGLDGDRRWMVVTPDGQFLSQRTLPRLALLQPRQRANELVIAVPGEGEIEAAPQPDGMAVTIWQDTLLAETCAPAVDAALSRALGAPCRLVHLGDLSRRKLKAAYRRAAETVTFADAFPLLLTSEASLGALNARLPDGIRMNRFRPNLVIGGAPAWAEDCWRLIRIGPVRFRVAKPCDRCMTTTVEQETGLRPDKTEPLRTLGAFRRTADGVMFGQNIIPLEQGTIAAGMTVEVLDSGPSNVALIAAA